MRLVGGKGKNEGRIEVLNNNVWGSVCSNGFDTKDGNVICKYLGHPGLEEIYTGDKGMIKTDGAIWMNNLQCKGNEESPFDCVQSRLGEHDCNHNQDVAIKCSSKHMSHIVTSYCLSLSLQRLLVWLVVMIAVDAWKFITKGNGALCVVTSLGITKLPLPVA